jgi:glutamate-ammonia-ligase adenylyltransferase
LQAEKKKILSRDFIQKIVEYSAGYFEEEKLGELFSLFESEAKKHYFTHSSESNLLRVISGTYDKVSFLSDCLKYPHYVELLVALTFNSNYLTDILVRNPEYFYWIANPSVLENKTEADYYTEAVGSAVKVFNSFNAKLNAIRRFKRKEMLRIGAKDIFLKGSVEEITDELSCLAKAITAKLFSLCYKEVLNKYQLDLPESRYCLVSLGKLGGNELNYSSDIDLIIFYDENDTLPVKKEYQELITEVTLLFIESATQVTESGYIYRVDFRLRPDGKNSPLCRRLTDYLIYYEGRGEDWERQMLIKSHYIAGSEEMFERFKNFLTPFIYPLSFKSSPVEKIKKLKLNIENNLSSDANIKLVSGGIRDIEFSIQALQLINAGKIKSLREQNSLQALRELCTNNLLSENESEILEEAYIFYRRIEHYLQLMNDTQTHLIPEEGELLDKLSSYLRFRSSKSFIEKVDTNRKKVLKIFQSIVGNDPKEKSEIILTDINFQNPQTAGKNLTYLREGRGLLGQKEFDNQSTDAFDGISGALMDFISNSPDPDLILNNFVRVIKQAKFPSIWYDAFRDKKFFNTFLTICESSQTAVDIFAENKTLREVFLSKKVFQKILISDDINYSEFIFRISVQFTIGMIKQHQVSKLLSDYFINKIEKLSVSLNEKKSLSGHYFIGALGSLGSREMNFSSDIDLIFITDNLETNPREQNVFLEFLTTLRKEFSPVSIDCRLRPEGGSGMLVWDVSSYISYINSRARTWELQTLTKIKFITGEKKLLTKIVKSVSIRLRSEKPERLKADLIEMRKKMLISEGLSEMINLKKNRGGITDIEFILQYLILCNPQYFKKLRAKNIKQLIKGLIKLKPELDEDLTTLNMNYDLYKSLILKNQNMFHQSSGIIVKDDLRFSKLAKQLKFNSGRDLEQRLHAAFKETSSIFTKIFGI